ncbi:MAG: twin-arginine translocation signal domain-containing protein [Tunicatimonas sp.]
MNHNRRHFLKTATAAGVAVALPLPWSVASEPYILTVNGRIKPDALGRTFAHEHVLVDFGGADVVSPDRYDAGEAYKKILPYLKELKALGAQSFVECTPNYLGRDVRLLKRLAKASGLHILTNTGLYGAVEGKFLPDYVAIETAEQLARRWTDEFQNGIDGTGIRPGFIKIGVNNGPLNEADRKLVRAAALTHRATGLTTAAHTGDAAAAMEELEIIQSAGVHPSAWIWVHAQGKGTDQHLKAARAGAWVEIDGISQETYIKHAQQVKALRDADLLDRVLVSCDAGWYRVGEPQGGTYRSHAVLLEQFVPELQAQGFSDAEVKQLLVTNPAAAFAVRLRLG